MSRRIVILILLVLTGCLPLIGSAGVARAERPVKLFLRRAAIDPLATPMIASAEDDRSSLRIIQFQKPPGTAEREALAAAGVQVLAYVPDYAFLVRVEPGRALRAARIPGSRWSGPFLAGYKIAPGLNTLLAGDPDSVVEVRLLATPDAGDITPVVVAAGGTVLQSAGGMSVRARLTVAHLQALLARDDIIWVEQYLAPQLLNDRERQISGVPAVRQQLGLTGAGQIVAVADTGLDIQNNVSIDFAGRVVAGFANNQMSTFCSDQNWNDRNGHGTHVAGTILGNGSLGNGQFAGVAPEARLVVQAVFNGQGYACFSSDESFLAGAYAAGARIHNASWGGPGGGTSTTPSYGDYTDLDRVIDKFVWEHPDYLFVVAAGNNGEDRSPRDGVIDADSINTPGTAKNVLTVGATENDRQPENACVSGAPENTCWSSFGRFFGVDPFTNDPISNNPGGLAAFSSRGPANDGRLKPEIVAPGTNIISARSHDSQSWIYRGIYNADYAYLSGTSMSTPAVSGMAALVRQWLAQYRYMPAPSAALVKALLLNGATNISPGQYGTDTRQEIPTSWPNNAQGWGRASMPETVGLVDVAQVWVEDRKAGIQQGAQMAYVVNVTSGQPLRVTLAWADYPGVPYSSKALVNDLDLEVIGPDGTVWYGNQEADLSLNPDCREAGADRCNTVESLEIAVPVGGTYTLRVRGAVVPQGPQPFALVARATQIADPLLIAPTLNLLARSGSVLQLTWNTVSDATYYDIQVSSSTTFSTIQTRITSTERTAALIEDIGTYYARVRGCNARGCGEYSSIRSATITSAPSKLYFPNLIEK